MGKAFILKHTACSKTDKLKVAQAIESSDNTVNIQPV